MHVLPQGCDLLISNGSSLQYRINTSCRGGRNQYCWFNKKCEGKSFILKMAIDPSWPWAKVKGVMVNSIWRDLGGKDHMSSFTDWRPRRTTTQRKKPTVCLLAGGSLVMASITTHWMSSSVSMIHYCCFFGVVLWAFSCLSPQSQTANHLSSAGKALMKNAINPLFPLPPTATPSIKVGSSLRWLH